MLLYDTLLFLVHYARYDLRCTRLVYIPAEDGDCAVQVLVKRALQMKVTVETIPVLMTWLPTRAPVLAAIWFLPPQCISTAYFHLLSIQARRVKET